MHVRRPYYMGKNSSYSFPIVGQVRDNHYKWNAQSYNMTQHGFARDCEFVVVSEHSELLHWN